MDGNELGDVDTQSFIGRRRVSKLFMNSSRVTSLSAQTFNGLMSLEALHLEDNELKEIGGHEFGAVGGSLKELHLQNNDIVSIAEGAFRSLSSLSVLRLDGNLLTTFPVWSLVASHPMLVAVSLAENMWSCDCDFMSPFSHFLAEQESRVPDAFGVKCMGENLIAEDIDFASNISCHEKALLKASDGGGEMSDLVLILVSCSVAAVILLALFMTVCVFRAKIKAWLYHKSSEIYESRSGSSSIASGNTLYAQNKLFDIYISYSVKDFDFVDQSLAPTLERGATSYKLCLHQRDFPSNATVYDTVTVAAESSARVLIILSKVSPATKT